MRSWAAEASIERRVTGDRCEEKGCYGTAIWLISFNGETTHLCSKHTRMQMRETGRWAEAFGIGLSQKARVSDAG